MKRRSCWGLVVTAVVVLGGAGVPPAVALAPLDHAAVLAAIPGVVAAGAPSFVAHGVDESGEWSAAAGVADVKKGVPADPEAAFRIGSITKPMVAVAVLQLVDEGTIGLDAPVSTYLPGLLAQGDTVTIRHLLGHRSGLMTGPFAHDSGRGYIGLIDTACHQKYDPVERVRTADVQLFPPGTAFSYSNAGYTALQLVMEKVTGKRYEQVLTERVVVPLGLTRTSFQDGKPVFPGPYIHGYGDYFPGVGNFYNAKLVDNTDCGTYAWGAAGSGISTGRDLTTFLRALTGGQLLPDSLYQQMIDTKPTNFGPIVEYGLGIMRLLGQCEAGEILGHDGATYGYQTQVWTTLDGVRTMATALPVYVGRNAIHNAVGQVWNRELCAQ